MTPTKLKPVRFVDLQRQYHTLKLEIDRAIQTVFYSNEFILGKCVNDFEQNFADYLGCGTAIGVNSGTGALMLALKSLGIGPGDEVITVSNTFIATALAISECGAKPVFTDVIESTQLMNIEEISTKISSRTKVLLPVHLFGQMVNMEKINSLAKKHRLFVIEDACQAVGSTQNGIKAGTMSHAGCFSFYPGKNLGAYGDGGTIITPDPVLAAKIRIMRNHGSEKKYFHSIKGYNERLDSLQAVILDVKLKYLDTWNKRRNEIALCYGKELKNTGDITLPFIESGNYSNFHLYVLRTKFRDRLLDYLNSKGIQTLIHYPIPVHLQEAYRDLNYKKGDLPISEKLANEILSIPIHPDLTEEEIDFTVKNIKRFYKKIFKKL